MCEVGDKIHIKGIEGIDENSQYEVLRIKYGRVATIEVLISSDPMIVYRIPYKNCEPVLNA